MIPVANPSRVGARWTLEEDQELAAMYKTGLVIESMASTFQRTPGALRARLVKLCFEANGVDLARSLVKPEGDGKVWEHNDDDLLEALYSAGLAMPLLSKSLRRSEWASLI